MSARLRAAAGLLGALALGAAAVTLRPGSTPETAGGALAAPRPTPPVGPGPAGRLDGGAGAQAGFGVVAIEGVAERDRGGDTRPLAVGDVIERSDWVVTGSRSSLSLASPAGARLQLRAQTRLRLDADEAHAARLTLARGRLRAFAGVGRQLSVRSEDGAADARSRGGEFSIQAEAGTVRVVPHDSPVTLIARDEQLEVRPGQGAEVSGGRTSVSKVPPTLLLKVRWPEAHAQRQRHLALTGETAPGALVRGGGSEVVADDQGRFRITVPLREGDNRPSLEAEDLGGRRARSSGALVLVDSRPPDIAHEGIRY